MDSKTEFRKPSNDAVANRKYRRRSPAGGSSSSDGSSQRDHSSSPVPSMKDVADDKQKKAETGDLDRDSQRSYRHSDRPSSRSYHRYDDHIRRDGRSDDCDRSYSKSTYRSGRDSRGDYNSNYSRGDKEHRSRDFSDVSGHRSREKDISDRAGSGRRHDEIKDRDNDGVRSREDRGGRDEKTGRKNFGDRRSKYSPSYDESRGQRDELSSRRDSSGHRLKEAPSRDSKGLDDEKYTSEEKKRHDDRGRYKDQRNRELEEQSNDTKTWPSTDQESIPKKPKLFSLNSTGPVTNGTSEQAGVTDSDIDAAKVAAMKAAELVNKNLVGTGYMSTDQKKKLLWGSKKNTSTEESAHHWDTSTFGDRERQEKFNKLMSLRLPWCLWPIVGREGGGEGGTQGRQPGCGETAGAASVGIGEAVHGRIASQRWSNCWTWSLNVLFQYLCDWVNLVSGNSLYCMDRPFCKVLNLHLLSICCFLVLGGEVGRCLRTRMPIIILFRSITAGTGSA